MDWIERLTGISPDGGSGVTEVAILLALVCLIVSFVAIRRRARRRRA